MSDYLFSYGTLQQEAVQQYVFRRTLQGNKDVLPGYRIATKKIYGRYLVLEATAVNGAQVAGIVYALTSAELLQADVYEGPAYVRRHIRLKSGRKAWVYLEKSGAQNTE